MKVAICGSGPLGLQAAWHFHQMGASVILFGQAELGGNLRRVAKLFPELSLLSHEGKLVSAENYWNEQFQPLVEKIKAASIPIRGPILRVHKRFLGLDEEVPGKSRLEDLFRVIYNMGEGEELVESFDDVDIVIDARGVIHNSNPLGASNSLAINENKLSQNSSIYYGKGVLTGLAELQGNDKCLLVGSGSVAALTLVRMRNWLSSDPKNQLTLVTSERQAFKKFFEYSPNSQLKEGLLELIRENEESWERQKREFEKKIHQWRALDDFVKAKMPKPEEPTPQIQLFEGYNIHAIDHLEDREGFFVTCENIKFRNNGEEKIHTLALNKVFCATGFSPETEALSGLRLSWSMDKKKSQTDDGSHPEPGFYTLGPCSKVSDDRYTLQEGWEQLPAIEKKIRSYFSPAEGSHE